MPSERAPDAAIPGAGTESSRLVARLATIDEIPPTTRLLCSGPPAAILARMRHGAVLALILAAGCTVGREPNVTNVYHPTEYITLAPDRFEERVLEPMWPEEAWAAAERMQSEGWWVADVSNAGVATVPGDQPIRHKIILVMRRYADR